MILKEIDLQARRPASAEARALETHSRVICALLARGLGRHVHTPDFWKISINFDDALDDGKVIGGVLMKYRPLNAGAFAQIDEGAARDLLEAIKSAVCAVFETYHLDKNLLEAAASGAVRAGFKNTIRGKPVKGPADATAAWIEVDQGLAKSEVFVAVKRPDENRRVWVGDDSPDEFILRRNFGELTWAGPTTVTLRRSDGSQQTVSVLPA